MSKKKLNVRDLKFIEKQLRHPLSALFLVISLIIIYFVYEDEKVYLPTENAPVAIYCNQSGDNLTKTMKEAINSAKESITVVIFTLTDEQIIDALKRRAEEGVTVRIVHDAVATPDIGWKLGPKVAIFKRRMRGLMHDKIVIIDNRQVWFGSVNFTRESLVTYGNLLIGVESPQLANDCTKKAEAMMTGNAYTSPVISIQNQEQHIDFFFLPDQNQAHDKLVNAIETAKKSVKVAMFTFTDSHLASALIQAHRRGIKVEVVMDYESAKHTSHKVFQRFKREQMDARVRSIKGLLHYKMCIIDDEMLITGSANWTKAAFNSNDDTIAFIWPLTQTQQAKLDDIWNIIKTQSQPSFHR